MFSDTDLMSQFWLPKWYVKFYENLLPTLLMILSVKNPQKKSQILNNVFSKTWDVYLIIHLPYIAIHLPNSLAFLSVNHLLFVHFEVFSYITSSSLQYSFCIVSRLKCSAPMDITGMKIKFIYICTIYHHRMGGKSCTALTKSTDKYLKKTCLVIVS